MLATTATNRKYLANSIIIIIISLYITNKCIIRNPVNFSKITNIIIYNYNDNIAPHSTHWRALKPLMFIELKEELLLLYVFIYIKNIFARARSLRYIFAR